MKFLQGKRIRAPEIRAVGWAGEPLLLGALGGRVVLLDFFSFGDPEGIRSLPRIRALGDHYRDVGLTVLGIHVPAYEFERPLAPARQEIWRLGIPYPVALDHGFEVFRAYDGRDLPARVLVDTEGFVRGWHHGAGGLVETEKAIRVLVREAKPDRTLPPLLEPDEKTPAPGGLHWFGTPEIRFGAQGVGWGPPGPEGEKPAEPGESKEFGSMPDLRAEGRAYLQGRWSLGRDRICCDHDDGALAVVFEGSSAMAVVSRDHPPSGEEDVEPVLEITLDGESLSPALAGDDVEVRDGSSFVTIERGRLYDLISSVEFGVHNLEVRVRGRGVAFHLLFFGTAEVPEET